MRRLTTVVLIALAGLLSAARTRAELVVLEGGEVLKVTAFNAEGENARLTFKEGGVMTLPMLRHDTGTARKSGHVPDLQRTGHLVRRSG